MSSNNFQSNKSMNSSSKMGLCKVCKDAGKADFNHFVKNLDGSTNCPTLLSQNCRYCKNPGHTAKYCPVLAKNKKEDEAILRRANNSATSRPQQTVQVNCFASKNAFAGLESDESDEEPQSSKKIKTNMGSQLGSQLGSNNGNKKSTTIKTNNFSISSSIGSSKASAGFINPLCQPTANDFPELPKNDKPNYAAIAAKAEALEKAALIQKEKQAKEEMERIKSSTMLHLVGHAGLRTDSAKDHQSVKDQTTKETKLQKPTEEEMEDYQTCGNYIYDYIESRYRPVAHLAGKITGMIMELDHIEIKQLIKNSKELDNRIVEGIDGLKPKPALAQVVQVKVVEVAAVPVKSVITKRKIVDWTAEESDDEEPAPVETDNSAW